MAVRKILGPPGTGKTTKLIKYVKTFVKLGTPILHLQRKLQKKQ
jgi:KaiC/GvpD/RAD55 family RecA-like ATPase